MGGLECILDMVLLIIPTENTHVHTYKPIPTSIIDIKPWTFVEMGQYSGWPCHIPWYLNSYFIQRKEGEAKMLIPIMWYELPIKIIGSLLWVQ